MVFSWATKGCLEITYRLKIRRYLLLWFIYTYYIGKSNLLGKNLQTKSVCPAKAHINNTWKLREVFAKNVISASQWIDSSLRQYMLKN